MKPKLLQPFCSSLKARAPPWWNPLILESSVSPRQSAPSNNLPEVKLPSPCQRTLAAHYCLPGGTSFLFGSPPLTMLTMLLWCLWLLSQPPSCSIFGSINVAPLPHIAAHWSHDSHCTLVCCRVMSLSHSSSVTRGAGVSGFDIISEMIRQVHHTNNQDLSSLDPDILERTSVKAIKEVSKNLSSSFMGVLCKWLKVTLVNQTPVKHHITVTPVLSAYTLSCASTTCLTTTMPACSAMMPQGAWIIKDGWVIHEVYVGIYSMYKLSIGTWWLDFWDWEQWLAQCLANALKDYIFTFAMQFHGIFLWQSKGTSSHLWDNACKYLLCESFIKSGCIWISEWKLQPLSQANTSCTVYRLVHHEIASCHVWCLS